MPQHKLKTHSSAFVPYEIIASKIYLIRGQKAMLDKDLTALYGVKTKVINQAVKRNITRFPGDFMFKLNKKEAANLRSQFVTSSHGGRRYLPYVFTEHGVAMLSSVLNSEKAIQVNVQIMRTFVKIRTLIAHHEDLQRKINYIERTLTKNIQEKFGFYDKQFRIVFRAFEEIKKTLIPPQKPKRRIGFHH